MQSVMSHQFSQVPKAEIQRSVFDRSHGHKTAFDAGYLVPFYLDEALPGDTFKMNANIFARLQTQIVPVMDNIFIETFYFSVPVRLLWDNWLKFHGEKPVGDTTDYLLPTIAPDTGSGGYAEDSIHDYFGLPTKVENIETNALFHRAYNLIFNSWFQDQNLMTPASIQTGDGPDDPADYFLRKRAKKHDYFTSCLPWPQKGNAVTMPLGTIAPVYGDGKALSIVNSSSSQVGGLYWAGAGHGLDICEEAMDTNYGTLITTQTNPAAMRSFGLPIKGNTAGHDSHVYADLENATAATINSVRQAFQLQRMLERDARGGSRYVEIIKSHFNVSMPHSLYRPEYLGGSSSRINVNTVMQTSESSGTPQGNLAAYAVASDQGGFNKSFVEHCIVMGIVNVRADITYQTGIPRMFSRSSRYDFYWPALAHLGEQEVLNKEIFADGSPDDELVFGYQERYAEYRYYPSMITGKLRSNASASLDVWHLSQDFGNTLPELANGFIEDKTDDTISRLVAIDDEPQIIFDSYMNLKCARPMPVYSVPGLVDHF
ncbi:MAG: major capsid protein [Arizlama microvirus]|nr:MAG: major capsid protein [Arizlama microvirus]